LLDRPSELADPVSQSCDQGRRALGRQAGEKDDPDARAGQRLAPKVR
jgi:hypothetical protein